MTLRRTPPARGRRASQSNQQGLPKSTLANVHIVLSNHQGTKGSSPTTSAAGARFLTRNPPWANHEEKPAPRDVTDADAIHMATWLSETAAIDASSTVCREAINGEAHFHSFDKVRENLLALEGTWDGVPRLDQAG